MHQCWSLKSIYFAHLAPERDNTDNRLDQVRILPFNGGSGDEDLPEDTGGIIMIFFFN